MVVPDAHDENHSLGKSCAHGGKATLNSEFVGVAKGSLLSGTETIGDGVSGDSRDGGLRVGDNNASLNVESSNLRESTGGSSVLRRLVYALHFVENFLHC